MKTILATLAVALFLSACQTTQVASKPPAPLPNVDLEYTQLPPSYSAEEAVGVVWVCLDPKAILLVASAPSEDAYLEAISLFYQHGLCVVFKHPVSVTLKKHQLNFKGALGHGEVWTVETKDNSNVFVLLGRKTGQKV